LLVRILTSMDSRMYEYKRKIADRNRSLRWPCRYCYRAGIDNMAGLQQRIFDLVRGFSGRPVHLFLRWGSLARLPLRRHFVIRFYEERPQHSAILRSPAPVNPWNDCPCSLYGPNSSLCRLGTHERTNIRPDCNTEERSQLKRGSDEVLRPLRVVLRPDRLRDIFDVWRDRLDKPPGDRQLSRNYASRLAGLASGRSAPSAA